MNHLLRAHAPITAETWAEIDEEATSRLAVALGARKLVDFSGPLGWRHSATDLGRVGEALPTGEDGVEARARRVLPLAEVKAGFSLSRAELEAGTRGAPDVDYGPLDDAARAIARVENTAILEGWTEAGILGVGPASPHEPVPAGTPEQLAERVAAAVAVLKGADVGGPYALALDEETWVQVTGGNDVGGAPLLTHVQAILEGDVELVPGIGRPVVLSRRGGDFLLETGQDMAIGFSGYDAGEVHLYLQETLSFRVATPEAAVVLA